MQQRTSNQSYGNFYPSRDSSNRHQQPSQPSTGGTKPYSFNSGHTPYTSDYYSHATYENNNNYTDKSAPTSHKPQFNVNVGGYDYKGSTAPTDTASGSLMPKTTSSGLPNLGNTCYMNSTLQCLFNTNKLSSYFASGRHLLDAPNPILTEGFGQLLATSFSKTMTADNTYDALDKFKSYIGEINSTFMGYSQHDAHEILRFILEKMHKELNQAKSANQKYTEFKVPPTVTSLTKIAEAWTTFSKEKEHSRISAIFGGSLLSEVTCELCRNKSYTFENTLDLSLDIPKDRTVLASKKDPVSLNKCLQEFTTEVNVSEYLCSKCKKKGRAKRKVTIWKQPEILITQFKRFVHDKYGNLEALKDLISFPLTDLSLEPFTHRESKETRGRYSLYGIVNHYGDLDRGHYISVIYNEEEAAWYLYDDDKVSKVNKGEIEKFAQGSSYPYLLFYKRV